MPSLTISLFEGRTQDDKRELAKKLTEVVVEVCKCPPDAVTVKFEDLKRDNYAKAGIMYSDK